MDKIVEEDIPIINVDVPPPPPAIISEDLKIVADVSEIEETIIGSTEVSQSDTIEAVAMVEDVEVEEVEEEIIETFVVIENVLVSTGC